MPEMMSLTNVCEPKPIATPTTPAPAIRGPTCTPRAERHQDRHHRQDRGEEYPHDRQERPDLGLAPLLLGRDGRDGRNGLIAMSLDRAGSGDPAVDRGTRELPQIGDQKDHDRMQRAAHQSCRDIVLLGERAVVDVLAAPGQDREA